MRNVSITKLLTVMAVVFGNGLLVALVLILTQDPIISTVGWVLLFSFIAFAVVFCMTNSQHLKFKKRKPYGHDYHPTDEPPSHGSR